MKSRKKQILDEQWNTDYLEGLERIASEDSSNIRKADDTHYPRKADRKADDTHYPPCPISPNVLSIFTA